jgi:hypothetical protein
VGGSARLTHGNRSPLAQFDTLSIVQSPLVHVHCRQPHSVDAPSLETEILADRVLQPVVCVVSFFERTVGLDLIDNLLGEILEADRRSCRLVSI